jgi:hypothetical protein
MIRDGCGWRGLHAAPDGGECTRRDDETGRPAASRDVRGQQQEGESRGEQSRAEQRGARLSIAVHRIKTGAGACSSTSAVCVCWDLEQAARWGDWPAAGQRAALGRHTRGVAGCGLRVAGKTSVKRRARAPACYQVIGAAHLLLLRSRSHPNLLPYKPPSHNFCLQTPLVRPRLPLTILLSSPAPHTTSTPHPPLFSRSNSRLSLPHGRFFCLSLPPSRFRRRCLPSPAPPALQTDCKTDPRQQILRLPVHLHL